MTLSNAQLELRKTAIGASEIAAIAGLSPWATPIDIYMRKVGLVPPSGERSEQSELGDLLEPAIARLAAKRLGIEIEYAGGRSVQHPEHSFLLATPDYVVLDPNRDPHGVLEIKSVGYRVADRWGDEPPDFVVAQVQTQLACTGLRDGIIAALIGGRDLRTYEVPYDAEFATGLIAIAREFWEQHVVPRIPPELDETEASRKLLAARYPRHVDDIRPARPEIDQLAKTLREARVQANRAYAIARLLEYQICAEIGDAAGIETAEGRLTWKMCAGRPEWKQIALGLANRLGLEPAELDALVEKFRGEPFRRFNMPRSWGKGDDR